jgi:hypothetical protein
MAQKFLTNIDLNQNQLVNAKFEVLATDPSSGNFEGRLIYNSTEDVIKVWSGTAWRTLIASTAQTGGATNGVISGGTYAAGLTITESNGQITVTPNLATSSIAGLLTAADFTKLADATSEATASKLVIRDASGNAKVADPTLAAHIATKGYVDAARQGLDVKQSVRVASTANVAISTGLEAGDVIDGVTLVAGDRVLLKNQTTTSENGIYVAVASGAASRSSDANGTADIGELKSGTFAFVEEGTVNFDSGFVVSTDGTITVGTTGITWTQFSGAGSFDAGDGLSKTGTQVNVNVTANRTAITSDAIDISANYVGQSSITTLGTITTGVWNGTDVAVADGGTGASDAATARTNLGIQTTAGAVTTSAPTLARVAKQACAASASLVSTTVVTHNFNTTDVNVQIYEVSTGATVIGDVIRTNANALSVVLYGTISAADYTIVVVG